MKKIKLTAILSLLLALFVVSCTSDDTDPNMEPNALDISYSKNVKAIIDGNCLGCHGNPASNGAPMSLTTYAQVKDAAQNRNMVNLIVIEEMPPAGALTNTQIQTIKNWVAGGYKQ